MRYATSIIAFGFALFFFCAGPVSSAPRTGSFRIGPWTGAAYLAERDRSFDRCAAQFTGTGNVGIIYSLNSQYVWGLEFTSPTWNFLRGATLPITLRFGKQEAVTTRAIAISDKVLRVQLHDTLTLFQKLRGAWRMAVIAGGLGLTFDLPSGGEVIQALTQCVVRHQSRSRAAKQSGLFERFQKNRRRHSESPSPADPQLRTETSTLGAKILARTLGPKADTMAKASAQAAANTDAVWQLHGFLFTVSTLPSDPASEIRNLPKAAINRDAAMCRGQFFAGAFLEIAKVPSMVRAFTNCVNTKETTSTYYLGTVRKKGGLYLLSITVNAQEFNIAVNRTARQYADLVYLMLGRILLENL